MEIRSSRMLGGKDSTLSEMKDDGEGGSFWCYIVEDQMRDGPKVPGETAIPPLRYRIKLRTDSPKFRHYYDRWAWFRGMPWLQDVPGFTFVYIHPGLDDDDTEGCLLCGFEFQATTDGEYVIKSGTTRPAFEMVCKEIYAALDRDEEVWLTIDETAFGE